MGLSSIWRRIEWHLFADKERVQEKTEAFEFLLSADRLAHDRLADLEEILHGTSPVDLSAVFSLYAAFAGAVEDTAAQLNRITDDRHVGLQRVWSRIDNYARFFLQPAMRTDVSPLVVSLRDVGDADTEQIGGKAASLKRLRQDLEIRVPEGFVVTAGAWRRFEEENGLRKKLEDELKTVRLEKPATVDRASKALQEMVAGGRIPDDVAEQICSATDRLRREIADPATFAVRSSAVGEDGAASFAGQYRSLLNVDAQDLLDAYRRVLAGKYSEQALYYRIYRGLWDVETPMAVLVLEMIQASASGVAYTRDPRKPAEPCIRIHALRGQGEALVAGRSSPDLYVFSARQPPALDRRRVSTPDDPVLTPSAAAQVAAMALGIDRALGGPQDIEWCFDRENRLVLLQARPLRVPRSDSKPARDCRFEAIQNAVLVQGGETASPGIGAGPVYRVENTDDILRLPEGAVMAAPSALPELASAMGRIRALVTDKGSSAGHLATVAREYGVPALLNTGGGVSRLAPGTEVTVHADGKRVYEGLVTEMVESPCADGLTPEDTPFSRRMAAAMSFVSPLSLVDPQAKNFTAAGCRSLHDILRFAHEKAVESIFALSDRRVKAFSGARKLRPGIPMLFYVLDVGGGLKDDISDAGELDENAVSCRPLTALLRGLRHPGIRWGPFHHFDWEAHDRTAMAGTEADPDAAIYASHAVVSSDRMNLNLKFGYHFVLVDARYPENTGAGHLLFRFSGGGADMAQRRLRALFLNRILERIGFSVRQKSDLVDGGFDSRDSEQMDRALDLVGRLLGATRLMDMRLKDEEGVNRRIEDFFSGRYDFSGG